MLEEVAEADVRGIVKKIIKLAKLGNLAAVELLFKWVIGPPPPVGPDRVDEHELSMRRGRPTLLDQLLLDSRPEEAPTPPAAEPDPEALQTSPNFPGSSSFLILLAKSF
jgi:hypothetical protein